MFIDACVLFAPLVRRIVLGAAQAGSFRPFWSVRVLDEWQIAAARRHGAAAEAEVVAARKDIAGRFPDAAALADETVEAGLRLPDPADAHVLAAAIGAGAGVLLSFNLRDFPRRALAPSGIRAAHPDGFLWECLSRRPDEIGRVIDDALVALQIEPGRGRAALKRARLSRLGKAWEAGGGGQTTV